MNKRKAPKFNATLEDFRKFVGESEKIALYEQGKEDSKAPEAHTDPEVKEELPGGGETKGGPTDPLSTRGVEADEKVEGQFSPKEESPERKEVPASSKVASDEPESLVNRLLNSIKVAQEEIEKDETPAAKGKGESLEEVAKGDKDSKTSRKLPEPATVTKADEDEKKPDAKKELEKDDREEKAASEDELDLIATKIASSYRNVSVGYELGRFLFSTLGRKVADDVTPPTVDPSAAGGAPAPDAGAAAGPDAGGAPDPSAAGGDGGGEIQAILQALQELVQEGQVTPEQAQQIVMELQSASQGGAAPGASGDAAPGPEQVPGKVAAELFTPEQVAQIEVNINAKVATWVSEGKTDAEITELVKQAAKFDAETLSSKKKEASINEFIGRKVAALTELGYSKEDIDAFVKKATEEIEINEKIAKLVSDKAEQLKAAGYNEEQIEDYLKQAAIEDAKILAKENIKSAIVSKVAAVREEKIANLPPEMQQILQALQELLQTGQISEEEATQVLHELGLTGGGDQGGAPDGAAPGGAPGGDAPSQDGPPAPPEKSEGAPAEKKEEPKKEEKEEKKEESPDAE